MAGKNLEIARIFDEIADILELTGQSRFRVSAYHNAARSLRNVTADLARIATAFQTMCSTGNEFGLLQRYESRLSRTFQRCLRTLESRRARKLPNEPDAGR